MSDESQSDFETAKSLGHYLWDARVFENRINGSRSDDLFRSRGGTIVYSIDADILNFYVNRRSVGAGPRGYAKVFRNDPEAYAWAISEFIAESIFFEKHISMPGATTPRHLLLLPGMETEVGRVIQTIVDEELRGDNDIKGELADPNIVPLLQAAQAFQNEAAQRDFVRQHLPGLFGAFFGTDGIEVKADRTTNLLENASLSASSLLDWSFADRFPLDLIEAANSEPFQKRSSDLRAIVDTQLGRTFLKPKRAGDADSKAVGSLIAINEALFDSHVRVVHVTGKRFLHKACRNLFVDEFGRMSDKRGVDPDGTVADRYLRHPLSFWTSPEFVQNVADVAGSDELEIDGWTKWVRAIVPAENVPLKQWTSARLRPVASNLQLSVSSFAASWNEFSIKLLAAQAKTQNRFDNRAADLLDDLKSRLGSSFDRFFQSSGLLGLSVTSVLNEGNVARNIPPVVLEYNEDVSGAGRDLMRLLGKGRQKIDEKDYTLILRILKDAEPNGYFFYIGLALLFFYEQQYKASLTFAQKAIQVSEEDANARVDGREAYYLAAVVSRLLAKQVEDLDASKRLLSISRERLRVSRTDKDDQVLNFRYECEEIALELSRYLLSHFIGSDNEYLSAISIRKQCERLLERELLGDNVSVVSNLKLRTAVNALSALLHQVEFRERVTNDMFELERWIRIFQRAKLLVAEESFASFLHKAVIHTSECFLLKQFSGVDDVLARSITTDTLLSNENIQRNAVTSYDVRRFRALKKLCWDNIDATS